MGSARRSPAASGFCIRLDSRDSLAVLGCEGHARGTGVSSKSWRCAATSSRDARAAERQHGVEFRLRKGALLARALHFHKVAVLGHDEVHVHAGVFVFQVIQIEQRLAADHADADRGDALPQRILAIFFASRSARKASAAATQAPVIEAVRVPPSAWSTSQSMQSVRGPSASRSTAARSERPISRWISTLRPSSRPLRAVARFPLQGGVREHGVLRREPAAGDLLLFHPARHALLDHGGADDAGIAGGDEHRAGGVRGDAGLKRKRPQPIGWRPSGRGGRVVIAGQRASYPRRQQPLKPAGNLMLRQVLKPPGCSCERGHGPGVGGG